MPRLAKCVAATRCSADDGALPVAQHSLNHRVVASPPSIRHAIGPVDSSAESMLSFDRGTAAIGARHTVGYPVSDFRRFAVLACRQALLAEHHEPLAVAHSMYCQAPRVHLPEALGGT